MELSLSIISTITECVKPSGSELPQSALYLEPKPFGRTVITTWWAFYSSCHLLYKCIFKDACESRAIRLVSYDHHHTEISVMWPQECCKKVSSYNMAELHIHVHIEENVCCPLWKYCGALALLNECYYVMVVLEPFNLQWNAPPKKSHFWKSVFQHVMIHCTLFTVVQ